jgi:hypothetical protein
VKGKEEGGRRKEEGGEERREADLREAACLVDKISNP